MPEATVDEQRDASALKHEVGFPEQATVSSPAGDPVFSEHLNQPQLCPPISTSANLRHDC
jgi:hypothetical protein